MEKTSHSRCRSLRSSLTADSRGDKLQGEDFPRRAKRLSFSPTTERRRDLLSLSRPRSDVTTTLSAVSPCCLHTVEQTSVDVKIRKFAAFLRIVPTFCSSADSGTAWTNSFCYLWGSAGQPTLRLAFGKFLTVKAEISKWQLLHRGERGAVMEKEMSVKKNLPTNRNFVLQKCLGPQ